MIDTILGPVDERELVCEAVPFDGPDYYAFELSFHRPGSTEVIAKFHDVKWKKINDFLTDPPSGKVTTTRGDMSIDLLEKKTGVNDTPTEYNCWVEYRPIGEDEIVHRSAHTSLKSPPPPVIIFPGKL
jgi:hypothetical protein